MKFKNENLAVNTNNHLNCHIVIGLPHMNRHTMAVQVDPSFGVGFLTIGTSKCQALSSMASEGRIGFDLN